jgi:NAD(P)-dependent dehydrogenase (short-subunit alcohol dehydrogenase family)
VTPALGEFKGQVALVVGGASGIGLATARAFARSGADVAICGLNAEGARDAAALIKDAGQRAISIGVDVADTIKLDAVVTRTVDELGRLDAMVYAAGLPSEPDLSWLDMTVEEWDRSFAVNVRGAFVLAQQFARHVIERGGGGKIVNISSSSGFRIRRGGPAYAAAKAALAQLTRTLAAELAPYDVNVNTIAPGVTRTPMVMRHYGSEDEIQRRVEETATANLFRRVSEPEDVAAVALFLCLPDSRQITAQVIHTSAGAVV